MQFDIQRIRNLTTGFLHSSIGCIYEDIEAITGMGGIMTHMMPRAYQSIQPFLRQHITDDRFWNDKYDPEHVGTIEVPLMSDADRESMAKRYAELPNPLAGKEVVVIRA